MNVAGFQKLTTSDFPGVIAAIIFTQGCNFKCPYCHNSELITPFSIVNKNTITKEEIFSYLEKRKKLLDGVVISGGEPLIQKDVDVFIREIKNMGYKIKLDTNGTNPKTLKSLIASNLIDYVAMDIKNDFENYNHTIGTLNITLDNIKDSINILKQSNIDYEFRTTIVKDFHTLASIKNILSYIGRDSKYFIQNFEDSRNVLNHNLKSFTNEELKSLYLELKNDYPNFKIRGIKE